MNYIYISLLWLPQCPRQCRPQSTRLGYPCMQSHTRHASCSHLGLSRISVNMVCFSVGQPYNIIYPINIMSTSKMPLLPPALQKAYDTTKDSITEHEYFIINYDATNFLKNKSTKDTSTLFISTQNKRNCPPIHIQRVRE